jgi:flagellar hook-length control protein FliK
LGVFSAKNARKSRKNGLFAALVARQSALGRTQAGGAVAKAAADAVAETAKPETPLKARVVPGSKPGLTLGAKAGGQAKNARQSKSLKMSGEASPKAAEEGSFAFQAQRLAKSAMGKAGAQAGQADAEGGVKAATGNQETSKPKIEVIDLRPRARASGRADTSGKGDASGKPETAPKTAADEKPAALAADRISSQPDISIDVGSEEGKTAGRSDTAGEAPGFAARLAERLEQVHGAEIVERGSLVLREGGAGMIRLSLRPESLGNVKVSLKLTENNITGTIIVESEEAKAAFEANLERLTKGFVDSGFQGAKLEVSVDSRGGRGWADQGSGPRDRGFTAPAAWEGLSAAAYGASGASGALDILV